MPNVSQKNTFSVKTAVSEKRVVSSVEFWNRLELTYRIRIVTFIYNFTEKTNTTFFVQIEVFYVLIIENLLHRFRFWRFCDFLFWLFVNHVFFKVFSSLDLRKTALDAVRYVRQFPKNLIFG